MADFLPPVVAVLLGNISDYSAKMDEAAAKAAGVDAKLSAAGKASNALFMGVGLAVAGVAVATVKMASDFQTQMTRLYTAAGAPKQAVLDSYNAVLSLGNAMGFTGTQMAEALYHPVSAGLDLKTSLEAVKYAAEEAQISGASLDDTTYSLSSVMKAFNLDASQAHNTMATLNAIVGEGDMRFQDFNVSIKNWAPTAAQMGISITSMGAALAYLTDRGNSAEEAATRVTMGLTMMATPSKQAASLLEGLGVASSDVSAATDSMTQVLKKTGITQNQLAQDLRQPDGIYVALQHLKTALDNAGVSGTEADSVLSKIFGGGRSDKAIMSLLQNLDGLKTKFQDITGATGQFDQAFADTTKTFAFQIKQLGAEAANVGIKIGLVLIPVIQSVIGWFQRNGWAADALGVIIGGALTIAMIRFAQIATTKVLTAISSVITGLVNMATQSKATAAETEAAAAKTEAASAATGNWATSLGKSLPVIGLGITALTALGEKLGEMAGVGDHTGQDVDQLTSQLLDMANHAPAATQHIQQLAEALGKANTVLSNARGWGSIGGSQGPVQGIKDLDTALGNLVSSGNINAAKSDFDAITKAMQAQGVSADQVKSLFPGYTKALEDAATQQKQMADASKNAGTAVGSMQGPLSDAGSAANDTATAIDSVTQAFNTLTGNITASDALNKFKEDLLKVTDDIQQNGKSLSDNTAQGLANRDAFNAAAKQILDYRDAQIKNHVSTQQANQDAANEAQQLINVWEQLTGNKKAVDDYAASLGLIPANLITQVTVDTSGAMANLDALQRKENSLQVSSSQGSQGRGPVKAYARGGVVDGPLGAPQLAVVHGGEIVVPPEMLSGAQPSAGFDSWGLGSAGGSVGGTPVVINVNVGALLSTKGEIKQAIQEAFLQNDMRNTQNGLTFATS